MVSSSVSPVNTRIVSCFSPAVSVAHDGRSLDTGTFSGNQKLPVSRSQTSASLSSCRRFQLIAETRSISFMFSLTRTPLRQTLLPAALRAQTLPLGSDKPAQHKPLCLRVVRSVQSGDQLKPIAALPSIRPFPRDRLLANQLFQHVGNGGDHFVLLDRDGLHPHRVPGSVEQTEDGDADDLGRMVIGPSPAMSKRLPKLEGRT